MGEISTSLVKTNRFVRSKSSAIKKEKKPDRTVLRTLIFMTFFIGGNIAVLYHVNKTENGYRRDGK